MNTDTNSKLPPPDEDLRADLWPTMTLSQLHNQRDMVVTKISKLNSMMSYGAAPPAIAALHSALQMALKDLTNLIDNRSTQKPTQRV